MTDWLQSKSTPALAMLAFSGSLAFGLAAPPNGTAGLAWVGFVPLLAAASGMRGRGPRGQFWVGWTGGLCTGLVGFPWITGTLERFGGFPTALAGLGWVGFSAWTAVPYGLWLVAVARGPSRGPWCVAWSIATWVGITQVWPAFFPHTPLIGLTQSAPWIQAAEVGGVPLVEAIAIGFAHAVIRGLRVTGTPARVAAGALAVAIPATSWVAGSWRLANLDAAAARAPTVRFGVVQPNTALLSTGPLDKMARLWSQSAAAQREGAQVVVWPEAGIYPWVVERPWTRDGTGVRAVLRAHQLPTILGVASRASDNEYDWNTAVIMDAQGEVRASFDKTKLMPLGERIPVVDPGWAQQVVPAMSHNNAGQNPARFPVELADGSATYGAGPLICFEDVFAGFARRVAAQDQGIEFFVNLTIDTWFGDTAEPWQHLALAQFRSVEHRVPMVRSVAAGASSVVDYGGRVTAALPVAAPTSSRPVPAQRLVHDVRLPRNTRESPTLYARGGWLLGWLCVAVTALAPLAALGWSTYRRRV